MYKTIVTKKFNELSIFVFFALLGTSFSAHAFLIDFGDLLGDEQIFITDPIVTEYATFTALPYDTLPPTIVYSPSSGSFPGEICPYDENDFCVGFLEVTFSKPVNNLSFYAGGNENDDYLLIDVFGESGLIERTSGQHNCGWYGNECDPNLQLVDLSDLSNITRLEMEFGDLSGGVAISNIQGTVVPIPAAAWIFGSGLIGLIGIARRKNT